MDSANKRSFYHNKKIMKKMSVAVLLIIAGFFLLMSAISVRHSRIVTDKNIPVSNPEMSQMFYGELKGTKNVYEVKSDIPFDLYIGLMVPDIEGARKDFFAEIYQQENYSNTDGTVLQKKTTIALLDGMTFGWANYYDPILGDNYFRGPEFRNADVQNVQGVHMEAGTYLVQVFNPDNEGKYVLTLGTKEKISSASILETIKTLPALKTSYFGKTPFAIFWNLIGLYILASVAIVLALLVFNRRSRGKKYNIKKDSTDDNIS